MEAWLTNLFGSQSGLIALFLSGFFVAMFIPGGAEVFLFSTIKLHPQMFWQAILVASLGNVLAGMTTYWVGRLLPEGKSLPDKAKRWLNRIHEYGQPIMLIAWVPWLGEAICIAAGWLRLNFPISALFLGVGIFVRFWLTALAAR
jgi:membrane protein YqaA with SNARE-associated domain